MNATTQTAVAVPDGTASSVDQSTQYGMRFPDGSIQWGTVTAEGQGAITVQLIHEKKPDAVRRWDAFVAKRAAAARIEKDDYALQHRILQRTVVLAVTEAVAAPPVTPDPAPPAPPFEL